MALSSWAGIFVSSQLSAHTQKQTYVCAIHFIVQADSTNIYGMCFYNNSLPLT